MPGARTRRINRVREIFPFVKRLEDHLAEIERSQWTRPVSRGDWFWLPLPISKNGRGDEPLAESNFRVAQREIESVAAFGTDYRVDAWPGGVIHTLMIRADDPAAVRMAQRLIDALEEYPILDEMDLAEEEWNQNHPREGECYAEEECGCEVAEERRRKAERSEYHESRGHVQALSEAGFVPDVDDDGDWWCPDCEEWVSFTEEEMAFLRGCADM